MALKDEILENLAKNNVAVPNDAIDTEWFIKAILESYQMGYEDCENDN